MRTLTTKLAALALLVAAGPAHALILTPAVPPGVAAGGGAVLFHSVHIGHTVFSGLPGFGPDDLFVLTTITDEDPVDMVFDITGAGTFVLFNAVIHNAGPRGLLSYGFSLVGPSGPAFDFGTLDSGVVPALPAPAGDVAIAFSSPAAGPSFFVSSTSYTLSGLVGDPDGLATSDIGPGIDSLAISGDFSGLCPGGDCVASGFAYVVSITVPEGLVGGTLTFSHSVDLSDPVPEPHSVMLLLAGLGLLGAGRLARR